MIKNNNRLETPRTYLRNFCLDDLDLLYQLHSDPQVMRYFYTGPRSRLTVQQNLQEYITHQETYNFSNWAVFEKNTDQFIGRAGPLVWDQPTIQLATTNPTLPAKSSAPTSVISYTRHPAAPGVALREAWECPSQPLGDDGRIEGPQPTQLTTVNWVELSYVLHQKFWGLGFATEIASQIITWVFKNLTIDKIIAVTTPENLASQKVMSKIGMQLDQHTTLNGFPAVQYMIYRTPIL